MKKNATKLISYFNLADKPPPPDLTLTITEKRTDEGFNLEYHISISDVGIPMSIGSKQIRSNSQTQFIELLNDIDKDISYAPAVENRMKNKGIDLYEDLFPDDFKNEYVEIKDKIKNIMILSDNPQIPWEIVKPLNSGVEDEFLCEKYSISRWLLNTKLNIKRELKINKIILVIPPDSGLTRSLEIGEWIEKKTGKDNVFYANSYDELLSIFKDESDFDLMFFSTHGEHNPKFALSSKIFLKEGHNFEPLDIDRETELRQKPLIIMNTCNSARMEYGLINQEGWVKKFLESGASCFIGTMWSVSEDSVNNFNKHLWNQLSFAKKSIGEAMKDARKLCKMEGDPSWLAYILYGHPNLKINFNEKE